MKLKVFVDANLSLKVYRPLHPKRVIMAAAHFTTTPCKPYTVPKVQGKPHFSARLNTLRAPKVRVLRIKGRFYHNTMQYASLTQSLEYKENHTFLHV